MDDLKIRQKCEEMIAYGYVAIRQFPKFERQGARRGRVRAAAAVGDAGEERKGMRLTYIIFRIANDLVSLLSRALNAFIFGGSTAQTLSARSHLESAGSEVWAQ